MTRSLTRRLLIAAATLGTLTLGACTSPTAPSQAGGDADRSGSYGGSSTRSGSYGGSSTMCSGSYGGSSTC